MTLQEIINILKKIALTQPNVRTATSGDIYEVMNGNPSVKYGVFHITQNTHQSFDNRDVYGLNLFYVDRNEDDNANTLQVQSVGKTVIDNIVKSFCEEFDGEFPTITYTPFTQRFKDDTAGVFAGLSLEVYKEWTCAEGFGDFITPQVIVRNQDKTIKVTQSGIYVVTPDEGYTGLGEVVVDVEMEYHAKLEDIELDLVVGDSGSISASEGYDAIRTVEYKVTPTDSEKMYIPNGITFEGSTNDWSDFPWDDYNWELVYDGYNLFKGCHFSSTKSLTDFIKEGKLKLVGTQRMFENAVIDAVDGFDFTDYTITDYMFSGATVNSVINCKMGRPAIKLNSPFTNTIQIFKDCDLTAITTLNDMQTLLPNARYYEINDMPDYTDSTIRVMNTTCLNLERPSTVTRFNKSSVGFVWYKPDAGWEELMNTNFSNNSLPMGALNFYANIGEGYDGEKKLIIDNGVNSDTYYFDDTNVINFDVLVGGSFDVYADNQQIFDNAAPSSLLDTQIFYPSKTNNGKISDLFYYKTPQASLWNYDADTDELYIIKNGYNDSNNYFLLQTFGLAKLTLNMVQLKAYTNNPWVRFDINDINNNSISYQYFFLNNSTGREQKFEINVEGYDIVKLTFSLYDSTIVDAVMINNMKMS